MHRPLRISKHRSLVLDAPPPVDCVRETWRRHFPVWLGVTGVRRRFPHGLAFFYDDRVRLFVVSIRTTH